MTGSRDTDTHPLIGWLLGDGRRIIDSNDFLAAFGEADIALFEAMMPALAMNLEVQVLRRTARTLLDTYVRRRAAGAFSTARSSATWAT